MPVIPGDQGIAAIFKHDNKTTCYKIALLRAINDVILMALTWPGRGAVCGLALSRLTELWVAYCCPFADAQYPIYQGARTIRDEAVRNNVAFRPDNRRPLLCERNQVDILLHESHHFTCPWTQKLLTQPQHYELDHLLPLAVYPVNELWNLLPVACDFNQHTKRDKVPDTRCLTAAERLLAAAYSTYHRTPALQP